MGGGGIKNKDTPDWKLASLAKVRNPGKIYEQEARAWCFDFDVSQIYRGRFGVGVVRSGKPNENLRMGIYLTFRDIYRTVRSPRSVL